MTSSRHSSFGLPGWLIVIGVMTGIGPVSIDLYLPAFPLIEATFGERGAERTMASYMIGLALGQLLYGPISDRVGRKPPLYFGFVIYTLGAIGCALSTSMNMLIAFRVLQALGACAGITIGRAIVRDRCEPEQAARAFSTLMAIVSVAPILAPIFGGFIVGAAGWRAAFYFQAGLGLGVLIIMHFTLAESLHPKNVRSLHPGSVLLTYLRLIKDRTFFGYSLIGGFAMASLLCFVSGAPTVLTNLYHVSPETFGWMIGMNGFAFMAASRLNLHALRTKSPAQILARFVWIPPLIGVAIISIGLFSYVPLPIALLLQVGFFVSTARVTPNVSALALANHSRNAGSASALLGSLQSIAAMTSGLAMGTFNNGTFVPMGIIMTASVTLCLLIYLWVRAAHRPTQDPR